MVTWIRSFNFIIMLFFVMSSDDTLVCPVCGGTLKYRDTRPRIRKKEGGVKEYLMIRRLRCTECHRHHGSLTVE